MVEHPHVVSVHVHVVTSTEVCLIFEPLAWDLSAVLDQRCFDECQTRTVLRTLLLGVTVLHARNIMHRDLKRANLLLSEKGVLKIADFGVSALSDECAGGFHSQSRRSWRFLGPWIRVHASISHVGVFTLTFTMKSTTRPFATLALDVQLERNCMAMKFVENLSGGVVGFASCPAT